ncbi:hypothetical protein KXD40_007678 [Peronospora effusa]|uniref:Uncharacterized protein n=1 Tax=Peronospora effusa TaxID=542832 RepID=A0A3M6VD57_9STRA|nr:hypothetical protein DD238_005396 [Peronospora effusa]RQM13774.1 hypothetical protein DD237_006073 [Peronospora effusa]UIZ23438.1 hypothetical protein KXD40_007678 [Peronospora effusa]CAI5707398.1 unnamed protein product [Peronospora effusa]
MVGTSTSPNNSSMFARRRSRSEGSAKAAMELETSPIQSSVVSQTRCSMTELYVRTSDGVVFKDEEFQREIVAKAERLMETARSPESTECNALIAKKALKYREMRSRRPNEFERRIASSPVTACIKRRMAAK